MPIRETTLENCQAAIRGQNTPIITFEEFASRKNKVAGIWVPDLQQKRFEGVNSTANISDQRPWTRSLGIRKSRAHVPHAFPAIRGNRNGLMVKLFLSLLVIGCLFGAQANAGQTNTNLDLFQKFVNGKVPIEEAVVYRTVAKTNGIVFNRQWWRFACQEQTWYCQQLAPDQNNPTNLIPLPVNGVYGKSLSSFWYVDNTSISGAGKNFVRGSHLDYVFERQLMLSALSLNIPRCFEALDIADSHINWDNLEFRTMVVDKRDKSNKIVSQVPAEGRLGLTMNGTPAFSEHSEAGEFPAGKTYYYYNSLADGIPTEYRSTNKICIVCQKFITLKLGKLEFKEADGFVPSMFADMKLDRSVQFWTNGEAYDLEKGQLVSTSSFIPVDEQKGYGKLILLLCLLVATSIFLGLWYRRPKKQTT